MMVTQSRRPVAVFERIMRAYPELEMQLQLEHSHVEVNMDIPAQPGLKFDINVNLQNGDELHLGAGALWVEWFPCDAPEVEADFLDAVLGILSGEYRIVEYYRGKRAVHAKLQRPEAGRWKTVGTWSQLHVPIPWRKTTKVLQNVDGEC